jgi:hypothetical protein
LDPGPGEPAYHISESLETIFWLKILNFFDADPDPGSGIFLTLSVIRDGKMRIRDLGYTSRFHNTACNLSKHVFLHTVTLVSVSSYGIKSGNCNDTAGYSGGRHCEEHPVPGRPLGDVPVQNILAAGIISPCIQC